MAAAVPRLVAAVLPHRKAVVKVESAVSATVEASLDSLTPSIHGLDPYMFYISIAGAFVLGSSITWLMNTRFFQKTRFSVMQIFRNTYYRLAGAIWSSRMPKWPAAANPSKTQRDSISFTYVGKGRDRMSMELCISCQETNKLLRQLAKDAGLTHDTYEPCSLCKDRMERMNCVISGSASPQKKRSH